MTVIRGQRNMQYPFLCCITFVSVMVIEPAANPHLLATPHFQPNVMPLADATIAEIIKHQDFRLKDSM
jgi:hypothetical protein